MYRKSIYTKERATELEMNEYFCKNRTSEILRIYKEFTGKYNKIGKNRTIWGRSCGPSGVSGPSKFLSSPLPFPL